MKQNSFYTGKDAFEKMTIKLQKTENSMIEESEFVTQSGLGGCLIEGVIIPDDDEVPIRRRLRTRNRDVNYTI